jgi:hypothetical protein
MKSFSTVILYVNIIIIRKQPSLTDFRKGSAAMRNINLGSNKVAHWGCKIDILVSMIEQVMIMHYISKYFVSFSHAIYK